MSVLEAELDEIDEFIQSELGFPPLSPAGSLTAATEANAELNCFLPEEELLNESPLWSSPACCKSKVSVMNVLETELDEIDEFIQSELGFLPLSPGGSTTEVNELSCFLPSEELLNELPLWNSPENVDVTSVTIPQKESSNKVPGVEIEVQIRDLKDVYNKRKVKSTGVGSEYRLEDSKVTVIMQASEEITNVTAYTQRCAEAAIRTHDTLGPVKLEVNTLESDGGRRVVTVDLGSVNKTQDGYPVYWLEKGEILKRNTWELTIAIEFSSGLAGNVKSRPFRVTTTNYYRRKSEEPAASTVKEQRLFYKITGPNIHSVNDLDDCEKYKLLSNKKAKKVSDDTSNLNRDFKDFNLMMDEDFNLMMEEDFNVMMEDDPASPPLPDRSSLDNLNTKATPLEDKILFQPNTVLDRDMVTKHYSREQEIHYAVEHPELAGLLKLVRKQSKMITPSARLKANRHKASKGNFLWACGLCFFARQKKSTIKTHLIQRVCQKTIDNRKMCGKVAGR